MDFIYDSISSLGDSLELFWTNHMELTLFLTIIFVVIFLCLIIGSIMRKKKFNKLEKKLALQMDLIIRAEEDINKLYSDLNSLSSHIIDFNTKLASQNIELEGFEEMEHMRPAEKEKVESPYVEFKTMDGQQSIKSRNGKEYTVDQIINTIE